MMLCFRLRPPNWPLSAPISFTCPSPKNTAFTVRKRHSSPRMSSSSSPQQVIEHIVLFKVKDETEPSKVNAMVSGLNGLNSIDQVLYVTAGPVLRTESSLFSFTHMLHSRYSSKDDLAAYTDHPDHLRVAREFIFPICDDLMAVDWVAEGFSGPLAPNPGWALKVSLLKLKENVEEAVKDDVLGVIREIKKGSATIEQFTCGENFTPAWAKGFSIGSLEVFKGVDEMEAAESKKELVESHIEKIQDYLDGVIVIDYLIPGSASL